MNIDIRTTDTFVIANGNLRQCRGDKRRNPGFTDWWALFPSGCPETTISREAFIAVVKDAGHTVTLFDDTPDAQPFPTHVVRSIKSKAASVTGTEKACKDHAAGWLGHEVVPLAPPPLSPEMKEFVSCVRTHFSNAYTPKHYICAAADKLLGTGGAS